MKDKIREMLAFEDLSQEEKEKRGILGRIYGPCASISIPTRNGRGYNEKLWENVFEHNDIVDEMFENGGIPMELDHPVDREETDSSKIAAMMPEKPKRDKEGRLCCYVDLIDTPMGRIAYQLEKYGFNLGISSRGSGDVITDSDGNEIVDPDTYDFTTFDLVLLPAVKDARLTMVESLDKNMTNLKRALKEDLEKGKKLDGTEYSSDEKRMMTEELNKLGIVLDSENKEDNKLNECNDANRTDKLTESKSSEQTTDKIEEANNVGEDVIKSLQESLKSNAELEEKVKNLQNELAVRNTKVEKLEEELNKSNSTIVHLTTLVRDSKAKTEKISILENKLNESENLVKELRSKTARQTKITESMKSLRENINTKDTELSSLNEQLKTLKDSHAEEVKTLKESLESEKTSHTEEVKKLNESLNKSRKLVEDYSKLTNNIASKYIDVKAMQLGVKREEILCKLNESYTLDQVDEICEDLMTYKVNMSKLPFVLDSKSVVKLKEAKTVSNVANTNIDDDSISEATLKMAGLLK